MKRWTVRLGLSLMVAAGWWVQRLPAQTAGAPAPAIVIPAPTPLPPVAPPVYSADPAGPAKGPIKAYFNKLGRCCSSDVNSPGCGGTRAELQFIFGSCRYWFGEPCLSRQQRAENGK